MQMEIYVLDCALEKYREKGCRTMYEVVRSKVKDAGKFFIRIRVEVDNDEMLCRVQNC